MGVLTAAESSGDRNEGQPRSPRPPDVENAGDAPPEDDHLLLADIEQARTADGLGILQRGGVHAFKQTDNQHASSERKAAQPQHRRDIDGLRGIAVLMVILFHTQTGVLPGGFIGVDVFFGLSGYLITNNLLREVETTGGINLATFYARRFKRLLPMSSLILLLVTVTGTWFLPQDTWPAIAGDLQSAALYYANVHFGQRVSNYFDPEAANSPVMHYWSLSVEEQFYFVWPLTIAAIAAGTRCIAAPGGSFSNWRNTVLLVLVAALLCSLLTSVWLAPLQRSTSYFQTTQRTWELLAGALLSMWHSDVDGVHEPHRRSRPSNAFAYISMASLLAFACLFNADTVFPGAAAIGPVLSTVVILHAGWQREDTRLHALLSSPPLVFAGNLSYSLYLWHWPLLQYAVRLAHVQTIEELPWMWLAGGLGLTLLASMATYRGVETAGRHAKVRTGGVIAAALVATVVMAALPGFVFHTELQGGEEEGMEGEEASNVDLSTFFHLHTDAINAPLKGDMGMFLPNGTMYDPAGPSVVLLGDSHAQHWSAAVHDALIPHTHAQFFKWAWGGCPAHYPGGHYDTSPACVQAQATLPSALHALGYVDAVILGSWSEFEDRYIGKHGIDAFASHVSRFLEMMVVHTSHLFYLVDVPKFAAFDASKCGKAGQDDNLGAMHVATLPYQPKSLPVLQHIFSSFVAANPRLTIHVVDLAGDLLCDAHTHTCNWMELQEGRVVCKAGDASGHLNKKWARGLAPRIRTALAPLLQGRIHYEALYE